MSRSAVARLAAFALVVAFVAGGAALAGAAVGPDPAPPKEEHAGAASDHAGAATHDVRGLASAEDGLRLVVDDAELPARRPEAVRFRIADDRGATVRDFEETHTKRMHLILVRRDLTGFQHLHPAQAADGAWETTAKLPEPGSYRLFADFARHGENYTLAADLRADGEADLQALPDPAPVASADGYDVRLDGDAEAGKPAELRFEITRDGEPVTVEPYLGAGGHLVALRDGDLAFLHVHPQGDDTAFEATFPTQGRYRLFLQFKHEGRVHTVAFTQGVA